MSVPPTGFGLAACLSAYRLPDRAQVARLRSALARTPRCIAFIDWGWQAPSPAHPFDWETRARMLRGSLPDDERLRVTFAPVRQHYDGARTLRAVQAGVRQALAGKQEGVLWQLPDALREALEDEPAQGQVEWHDDDARIVSSRPGSTHGLVPEKGDGLRVEPARTSLVAESGDGLPVEPARTAVSSRRKPGSISGSPVTTGRVPPSRLAALYASDDPAAVLADLQDDLAPATIAHLHGWIAGPAFGRLRDEWRVIAGEKKAWSVAPWPVVLVTVDAVVVAGGHVLLIRRGRAPGLGLHALPGGFLDPGETVLQSALRELVEETGLPLARCQMAARLGGVKVFDHPQRSQRGRIVTHAHCFDLGPAAPPPVQGGDDAAAAHWVPVSRLPLLETQFHDDHFHILDQFLGLTRDP